MESKYIIKAKQAQFILTPETKSEFMNDSYSKGQVLMNTSMNSQ